MLNFPKRWQTHSNFAEPSSAGCAEVAAISAAAWCLVGNDSEGEGASSVIPNSDTVFYRIIISVYPTYGHLGQLPQFSTIPIYTTYLSHSFPPLTREVEHGPIAKEPMVLEGPKLCVSTTDFVG